MFKAFFKDQTGATAIEYAIIGAGMGLALLIAMPFIEGPIVNSFTSLGSHITAGK